MAKVTGVPQSVYKGKFGGKKKHQRRQQIRPKTRMNSEVPPVHRDFKICFLFLWDDLVYIFFDSVFGCVRGASKNCSKKMRFTSNSQLFGHEKKTSWSGKLTINSEKLKNFWGSKGVLPRFPFGPEK